MTSIITKFKKFISKLTKFIKDVAADTRIPQRDKSVIVALLVYLVTPVDLIPDWIPIFGLLDDVVALALILDYLFNVLDNKILLSHFPWSMRAFSNMRRISRLIALLTPNGIKKRIWKYERDPY
ncbi:MAG: DUF1232 domain-containing protein [Oligoflexia bacterium]|nr:DUF1232 domain-containing protein [Oligoflexia bacterium]MBF0364666.1 DUF1232 domain-containing protein [Oligoflexia bacterium]